MAAALPQPPPAAPTEDAQTSPFVLPIKYHPTNDRATAQVGVTGRIQVRRRGRGWGAAKSGKNKRAKVDATLFQNVRVVVITRDAEGNLTLQQRHECFEVLTLHRTAGDRTIATSEPDSFLVPFGKRQEPGEMRIETTTWINDGVSAPKDCHRSAKNTQQWGFLRGTNNTGREPPQGAHVLKRSVHFAWDGNDADDVQLLSNDASTLRFDSKA